MNYTDISSPGRRKAGWRAASAVALLLTGSVIGWSASDGFGPTASAAPCGRLPPAAAPAPLATASYAGVVEQVTPAVVTIRSERRVRNVSQDMPQLPKNCVSSSAISSGRAGAAGRCRSGVSAASAPASSCGPTATS